jgi:hypothetical protein
VHRRQSAGAGVAQAACWLPSNVSRVQRIALTCCVLHRLTAAPSRCISGASARPEARFIELGRGIGCCSGGETVIWACLESVRSRLAICEYKSSAHSAQTRPPADGLKHPTQNRGGV